MIWQDIAITITSIILGYAVIPQIRHGFKTKTGTVTLQTGIISALGLFSLAIIFITLNLILSSIIATINGIMWSILIFQRIKYGTGK